MDTVKKIIPLRINNEKNIPIIKIKAIKKRKEKYKITWPEFKA